MPKYNPSRANLEVLYDQGTDEFAWSADAEMFIGNVTRLAERGLGVIRDRKVGSYYRGDKLDIQHPYLSVQDSIPIPTIRISADQSPVEGGGVPYDNVSVQVVGASRMEAMGMLCEFIRRYPEKCNRN